MGGNSIYKRWACTWDRKHGREHILKLNNATEASLSEQKQNSRKWTRMATSNPREETNWYKAVDGLRYLEKGLVCFVDNRAKNLYIKFTDVIKRNTNKTSMSCSQCKINNLLPWHGAKALCPHVSNPFKCTGCNVRAKKSRRHCPENICGRFYDLIVHDHYRNEPLWDNTDVSRWTTDYWQIAKCYLSKGYKDKVSVRHTDAGGLLSICINSKTIQRDITHLRNFKEVSIS